MALDDDYLASLAAAIADGSHVDWAEAEALAETDEHLAVLQRLRALATLIAAQAPAEPVMTATESDTPSGEPEPADPEVLASLQDGRFVIERQLGRGGFGIVYQAYDRERKIHLALKSLHRSDISSVYDLKREFRALVDLSHPNLISLYELFGDGDHWFIAMELVRGVDFMSYVRQGTAAPAAAGPAPASGAPRRRLACDPDRLGVPLTQLAQALGYLHDHGKLHRDLKPSNVLVTSSGDIKLLDFGLTTDVRVDPGGDTIRLRGTPGYISPEQAGGERATEASDWYSFGVMLFEALTGQRPFIGPFAEVLEAKRHRDAPDPASFCEGIPEPLEMLCRELLLRNPEDRPTGSEVVERLEQIWPDTLDAGRTSPVLRSRARFVGRRAQLEALHAAFEASLLGRPQAVYVHGGSGMGKSALVRRFLDQLRDEEPDVVILEGRCYERESVPYKALDSLVDRLSLYLKKLPRATAEALLPRDVTALTRLFPILRRVDAVAEIRQRPERSANAQELRRRGFAAFRDLLGRIADRHPVVLVIDDLQWGDSDSADLIADVLRSEEPPVILFIACYRSEEVFSSTALRTLVEATSDPVAAAAVDVHQVVVDQLDEIEAQELATSLCRTHGTEAPVARIVRESGRSPFFIAELVQYAATMSGSGIEEPLGVSDLAVEVSLDSVITARVAQLDPGARRLLRVLALFGRPLHLGTAVEIAELGAGAVDDVLALRSARLSRTRVGRGGEELELYHDRIRESVVDQVPDDLRKKLHARIATVLEQAKDADPESLVQHFYAAGERPHAAVYAVLAADRAREALAFGRAVRQYRLALEFGTFDAEGRRLIQVKLGDSLAAGGHGHEAAQAYLDAAQGALAADDLELRRRAAEQLLRSGHIHEGLAALRGVLDVLGMSLPSSPGRALLSLGMRRSWLALRGLRFADRDRSQIPAVELVRIDACWTIATVIGVVDTIYGADYQARHLLLALESGESFRIARALALEIVYTALRGPRTRPRQRQLIAVAEGLAQRVSQPEPQALVTLARATALFFQGEWKPAHELFDRAEPLLRECSGVIWELDTAHLYHLLTLFYLGEVRELSSLLPGFLREARERDDLTAATNLRTRTAYLMHLAADHPGRAREEVSQGIAGWHREGFHAQHSWQMYAEGEIDLYEGRGATAYEAFTHRWPFLVRSLLLRIQAVRIESFYLRARCALLAAVQSGDDHRRQSSFLRDARRDARRLSREPAGWARALADLIRCGVATLGDPPSAVAERLAAAEHQFRALDMQLHASVALRRRGQLLGGRDGLQLQHRADAWMGSQSIRNPGRLADMIAPGLYTVEAADHDG